MDTAFSRNTTDADWSERFSHLSADRRRKILDRAARLIADPEANENEKEMSVCQIQAALKINSNLVLDVLATVRGSGLSDADIEKLRLDAASARSDFEGLVSATQTLRLSLNKVGIISKSSRLPETVEQWERVIDEMIDAKNGMLSRWESQLLQQSNEMEGRRKEILEEIEFAQKLFFKSMFGATVKTKNVEEIKTALANLSFGLNPQSYEVGQTISGKGIYAGVWEPKDRQGKSLGKRYNIFAAPEDLTDSAGKKVLLTFRNVAEEVSKLCDWNGYNGSNYRSDLAIYRALGTGSYGGEWFIPTRDILQGKNIDGEKIQKDNLYDYKDIRDFAGTFTTSVSSFGTAYWYWSCTEHRDDVDYVYDVRFTDGLDSWHRMSGSRLGCRPVRVEELTL